MRILLLFMFLAGMINCSSRDGQSFRLKVNVVDADTGQIALFTTGEEPEELYSGKLVDGQYVFKGILRDPGVYRLRINEQQADLFLDGEEMSITVSSRQGIREDSLRGSRANEIRKACSEAFHELYDKVVEKNISGLSIFQASTRNDQVLFDSLMSERLWFDDLRFSIARDLVRKYSDNVYAAYLASAEMKSHYEWGREMYDLLSPEIQQSRAGQALSDKLEKVSVSAIGQAFPDYILENEAGDSVRLDSLKGYITVIDCWASWCGPCRSEMKSLRRLYKDFEHKGLRVMSISLDDSREKWLKACQEEQLPWKSYRNPFGYKRDGIRADLGIEGIPYLVVLDREGRFVAKELHRNVLRKKVQDLLNSQREQVR
ncbi:MULTISPECIES: TlpA disulfide reductase family protein [Butyricimonas]|uniref:TlpA disulfide reductase family protein n=1 Tax=Butyricimonas TaxID=574697 RepID=UPI0007FB3260|nr:MULTISPECIES: TlpA disulfide reductase family protein [Butyricimonas]